MCGIAGILSTQAKVETLELRLQYFQCALHHRGPDDSGLWMNAHGSVGLAHTRLSILDLSSNGHQPMLSASGRQVICFNGEIYNFRELRAELQQGGFAFQTHSDTEVLLQLYVRDGEAMVQHLRGMFAFCLWDEEKQQALLARDPLGIKPLYIHEGQGRLAFASELRALVSGGGFEPSVNPEAVQRYFETGTVPEPLTLLREVRMLEAGHTLVWQAGRSQRRAFWSLEFKNTFHGDAVVHAREALIDSVKHHFVSDVPVGIFLSGGIDSTAILALANETGHRGIHSFSIAVDDEASNEGPVARRTAAHFGSEHHELNLDAEGAREIFSRFLKHLDQPTIDGLNTFTVSALARDHGMKVVLSGLGGDELFGGYSSFSKIPKMLRLHPWLRCLPGLPMLLEQGKPPHRRLADFVRSPGTVQDAYGALRGIFSKADAASLTEWIAGTHADQSDQPHHANQSVADAISDLELTRYMRNQLLRDSDVMSMAYGLELRVPLVDRRLCEQICQIPARERLRGHKALLTDAVPEVPEWVVNQKKRGFLFPYHKWLGESWGIAIGEVTSGAPVPLPNWYQQWSVFILKHCLNTLGVSRS